MCEYFSLSGVFCWVLRSVKSNIIQAVLIITSNHDSVRLFKQTCLLRLQLWVLYHRGICLTDCSKTLFSLDLVLFLLNIGLRCHPSARKGPLHRLRVWVPWLFLSSLFAGKPKVKSLQRRQLSDHLLKDVMVDLAVTWILAGCGRSTGFYYLI